MGKETKELGLVAAKAFMMIFGAGVGLVAFEWLSKVASPKPVELPAAPAAPVATNAKDKKKAS